MTTEITTPSDDVSFLSTAGFLGHLEPEALRKLVPLMRHRSYARGEVIYHRGDLPSACYVIWEGTVKVRVESPEGRELIYAIKGRGDSFGTLDVIHDVRHNLDAVAIEPCNIRSIPSSVFVTFMSEEPTRIVKALISYSRAIRTQFERLQDLVFLDGPGRLSKALLHYAVEETADHSHILKKPISQSQLAAVTGNSRESVSRWLKSLAHQGIVRLDRDGIVILKPELLRGQFDRGD